MTTDPAPAPEVEPTAPEGNPAPQPEPSPEPEPSAWYEGYDLSDEDVGYIQNKAWDNPAKAIGAYKELEKFHGVPKDQILKLPGEDAKAEDWEAVYDRLGRPEDAKSYGEFEIPEGLEVDTARVEWADQLFHKMGLNKQQRDALIVATAEYENGIFGSMNEQVEQQQTLELQQLQQEWGNAFEERSELGRRAAKSFLPGSEEDRAALLEKIEGAVGTSATLKLFANIGQNIGEDNIPRGESRPYGYTPEQAKSDIEGLKVELQGSPDRMTIYNQGKGPDYEKMKRLQRLAYGQGQDQS